MNKYVEYKTRHDELMKKTDALLNDIKNNLILVKKILKMK
jgi:hypothetical protein